MAETARFPATPCGEALKLRAAAARSLRFQRRKLGAIAAMAALPCALSAAVPMPVRLVWNVSASSPRGLYWVVPHSEVHSGDGVIAWLPAGTSELAANRGYLPLGVPLVKRVAGIPGDRICALRDRLTINGRGAAARKTFDARGRSLPNWTGCVRLGPGRFFLLGESPWSFDGRYFGASKASEIDGRAVLLWRA
jgi:conjugative transfer signal peptidase TraF